MKTAASARSTVDSCKVLGVDTRQWMEDVLLRIPENEDNRTALRELLADRWAKQTNQDQLVPTWNNLDKLVTN